MALMKYGEGRSESNLTLVLVQVYMWMWARLHRLYRHSLLNLQEPKYSYYYSDNQHYYSDNQHTIKIIIFYEKKKIHHKFLVWQIFKGYRCECHTINIRYGTCVGCLTHCQPPRNWEISGTTQSILSWHLNI